MKKIILTIFLTILISCSKEDSYRPPSDPKEAILGKWELIEIGNWPNMYTTTPLHYTEYFRDSIVGVYDYETEEYYISNRKYWIDSLFHVKYVREDGYELIFNHSYEFNGDKMRLIMLDVLAIYDTFIYQRKK